MMKKGNRITAAVGAAGHVEESFRGKSLVSAGRATKKAAKTRQEPAPKGPQKDAPPTFEKYLELERASGGRSAPREAGTGTRADGGGFGASNFRWKHKGSYCWGREMSTIGGEAGKGAWQCASDKRAARREEGQANYY